MGQCPWGLWAYGPVTRKQIAFIKMNIILSLRGICKETSAEIQWETHISSWKHLKLISKHLETTTCPVSGCPLAGCSMLIAVVVSHERVPCTVCCAPQAPHLSCRPASVPMLGEAPCHARDIICTDYSITSVSYTHLTLPTNREV